MFKKLQKRGLAVIMATMLVASMTAVSTSAVEVTTDENTVTAQEATVSTYVNEETGVKVESEAMTVSGNNVGIYNDLDFTEVFGAYEETYFVEIYTDKGDHVDYEEVPVTLYLPCEKENCYVILDGFESESLVQLDAEYVDGYYKVRMPNIGRYYICEYPLVEGDGELVQQTFVDEKTGISVSGMIESDSQLIVFDIKDAYNAIVEERGEDDFLISEQPIAMADEFDGYGIFFLRNLEEATTEGELTITLPSDNEGYEVRCISDSAPMTEEDMYEADVLGMELANSITSDEEMAGKLTEFINKIYPALESEYSDGKYVVKNSYTGFYFVAPVGSFVVTAEDVNEIRNGSNDDDYQEPTENPTEVPTLVATEVPTQAQTQAPTQVSTQASTQAPTQSSTQGKGTVNTGDARSIPILLIVFGSAVMLVSKKRLAK